MKLDDLRQSQNVEDRRGQHYQQRGGSPLSGLLLQLLFSSGKGRITALILIIASVAFGGNGLSGLVAPTNTTPASHATSHQVSDADAVFLKKVFASTEDFWQEEFAANGLTYHPATLVIYDGQTPTGGCGTGSAHAGPFYCPADKKVYIDLTFYQELATKYRAAGDFAMAYVIAHEVGHHVQNELGTMTEYNRARQGLSEKDANALNVRLELQADYYAGAWAKYVAGQGLLEIGDIEEAMQAAHAVGDDTLQEQAYGRTVPDSFTHGTSAQRQEWFQKGYTYGDIAHGDTFNSAL